MGHGIAQIAARAGCRVRLCDVKQDVLDVALGRIRTQLDRAVEKGKLEVAERDRTLERIAITTDLGAAASGADLLIEAVPEDPVLKQRVLAAAAAALPAGAILATNTSSLPLRTLVSAVRHPTRFLGLHFFNPPPVMPLVEIIAAAETDTAVLEAARAFVRRLGKEEIVVRDSPGFATSRLGVVLGLEAMRMLEDGVASTRDIDRAMELGYGHPMGPLKVTDLVGLDVRLGIAEGLARELDAHRFAPPGILRRKVERGELGKKSGRGFYRWTEKGPEPVDE
jgi:3-hydroxybutyryl-CoA dehydrogenase